MRIEHFPGDPGESFGWCESVAEFLQESPAVKAQWGDTPKLVELVKRGWVDGAARIAREVAGLSAPPVQGVRRRPVWKDGGDEVCLDKVRLGRLDTAWRGTARRLGTQAPRVRVVADMSMLTSSCPPSLFFLRGAAAVRLVDVLSEAGYAVELWMADGIAASGSHPRVGYAVTIKPFDAPFDMASAAAMCAHRDVICDLGYPMFMRVNSRGGGGPTPMIPDYFEEENTRVFITPDTVLDMDRAHKWMQSCVDTLEVSYAAERKAHL